MKPRTWSTEDRLRWLTRLEHEAATARRESGRYGARLAQLRAFIEWDDALLLLRSSQKRFTAALMIKQLERWLSAFVMPGPRPSERRPSFALRDIDDFVGELVRRLPNLQQERPPKNREAMEVVG